MRYPFFAIACLAVLTLSTSFNRPRHFLAQEDEREREWVDSVFRQLTEDERIGQLIMVRAHSDKDSAYEQMVEDQIRQYHVGGLCFFQGTPERQAILTNRYQAASGRLPLLISMDAEWGLGMRLRESTVSYPRQLMLGAIRDNRLIYEMGREVARQCRRLGVHVNFAPVADVNNNPANPVINDRSFGEDRYNVAAKTFQYMMGLQDGGVMACAKHFPGHGDTNVDSHFDLPVILHDPIRLDSLELFPFRVLSQYGIGSMMVAHLNVPAIDNRANRPTTLSRGAVYDLLRKKIGFEGLIFTDAMEMKGVASYFLPGEADLEALRAGNDIILLPGNLEATVSAIRNALEDGTLDRAAVHASVRRILRAKYRLGLTRPQYIDPANIRRDLNRPDALLLKRRLIANALTLVRDRPGLSGFPELEKFRLATLAIGDTNRTRFQQTCGWYAPMQHFNVAKDISPEAIRTLVDALAQRDVVLVSLHDLSSKSVNNYGFTASMLDLLEQLNQRTTVVLTLFGNPYALRYFDKVPVVLQAYTEDPLAQELAAQALFGAVDIQGRLPVTASPSARFGQGTRRLYQDYRLGYDLPEAAGMSSDTLIQIDSLVAGLIREGAAPGCQILVARSGKIVWHKAYGYYTYDSTRPVTLETLYDLASVTKVAATTVSLMQQVDAGKIDLHRPMSHYLPELQATNKKDLTTAEILVHQAGLTPWIPFYQTTLDKGYPSEKWYHFEQTAQFGIPVAANLFMANAYADSLWSRIFRSELRPDKSYKYSDLGLYLTARTLERLSGAPLDAYAYQHFYRPLGMSTTTFNPWRYQLADRCAPTEIDGYFRHQMLQGYVHDMGAAMLGGVAGHAGLFSNANDLAKLFQMLLNGGDYFGKSYIRTETVHTFTSRQEGSTRRGIGFDMLETNSQATLNMCACASPRTFGHTGFTGNAVWADPDKQLIVVFLSNRTYPNMENNKLINGNYRPRLQEIVYKAIIDLKI